ncbi:SDR family NAD(P)-dependent oxidoreductase, partial [Streptomyces lavendulae]|uniref:SDR family NAD(P)-dependent oxidoreductase n=1 Tax=Streptomyces lavendulae TaxID=1914 RepID=UPI00369D2241
MTSPVSESLEGRRALVTGGTKGTGAAIARRLAEAGAAVLVTGRSRPEEVEEETFIAADLSNADGTDRAIAEVEARLGGVDVMVHTLGGSEAPAGGFSALGEEDWAKELNVNLLGAGRGGRPRTGGRGARRGGRPRRGGPRRWGGCSRGGLLHGRAYGVQ